MAKRIRTHESMYDEQDSHLDEQDSHFDLLYVKTVSTLWS